MCSGFGGFNIPLCSGTVVNGYTSNYTASTTSSDGANGPGFNVASGLNRYTAGCSCGNLQCGTCASSSWRSSQYPKGDANSLACHAATNSGGTANDASRGAILSVVALGAAATALLKQ